MADPEGQAVQRLAVQTAAQARTLRQIMPQVGARYAAFQAAARELAQVSALTRDATALLRVRAIQLAAALASAPVASTSGRETAGAVDQRELVSAVQDLGAAAEELGTALRQAITEELARARGRGTRGDTLVVCVHRSWWLM